MNKQTLKKAIETYNKYRSPLVRAELLELRNDRFKVRFEGYFCYSCGVDEYFVDLIYELKSKGSDVELLEFNRECEENFIAEYKFV